VKLNNQINGGVKTPYKKKVNNMNKTKKEMIKEIMLFRYSSRDANYVDATNFEFIDYITNEYKKMKKEEIEIEYNFYLDKAYK
jgi:hypothetical protein